MTPEMIAWGRENYPHLNGEAITAEFVDYWRAVPGAKGVKLDWPATWRNWIRRKGEQASHPGRASPNPRRATTDERLDQADAALAELLEDRANGIPVFGYAAHNPNAITAGPTHREITP